MKKTTPSSDGPRSARLPPLLEEWQASDDPMKTPMVEEMLEMEREELIQMLLP